MGGKHKKDKRSKKEKKEKKEKTFDDLQPTSKQEVVHDFKQQPLMVMTKAVQVVKDETIIFHQGFGDNKMITPNAKGDTFTFNAGGNYRLELEADVELSDASTINVTFFLPEVESKIFPLLMTNKSFSKSGPASFTTATIVPVHAGQDLNLRMSSKSPFSLIKAKMMISPV